MESQLIFIRKLIIDYKKKQRNQKRKTVFVYMYENGNFIIVNVAILLLFFNLSANVTDVQDAISTLLFLYNNLLYLYNNCFFPSSLKKVFALFLSYFYRIILERYFKFSSYFIINWINTPFPAYYHAVYMLVLSSPFSCFVVMNVYSFKFNLIKFYLALNSWNKYYFIFFELWIPINTVLPIEVNLTP